MSVTTSIAIGICGLLATVSFLQAQGWRGIVPLQSTRKDVERLIGAPMTLNGITYDLKNERVNVGYADGGCEKGAEWNVPSGTVTSIIIYPQARLSLSDLNIDLHRFEKFVNPHNPDSVSYNNKEQGIGIGTQSNGEVVVIEYFPPTKDGNLRCPSFSPDRLSNDEIRYYKFDEYSNISLSDEKIRLDNFAAALKGKLNSKAYIITHVGRHASARVAKARSNQTKQYLIKVHHIKAEQIIANTVSGSGRPHVELYVLPPEALLPAIRNRKRVKQ